MPEGSGIGNIVNEMFKSMDEVYSPFEIALHSWDPRPFDSLFSRALESGNNALLYAQEIIRAISLAKFAVFAPRGYDLYHFASPTLAPLSWLKKPSVVTVYDMMPYIESRSLADSFLRVMSDQIKHCTQIICISENSKKDLLRFVNVDPKRVSTIYGGVNHLVFQPRDKDESRLRLGLPLRNPVVLSVGSEEPRKNISGLLRSFSMLCERFPNAILLRVGRKKADHQRIIHQLGLGNNIVYFNPPRNEIPFFYNAADLLCFPSYYEGFGLPPLEAMASGCPVIGGSRTSIPEIIGKGGVLVDPFDHEGIAFWMGELIENQDLRSRTIDLGLVRSRMFSWKKSAYETIEVYKQALREHVDIS